MNAQKGIAYCGLACCICGQNDSCMGCRNEGCKGRDWCKNYKCCREKGLNGCWECAEFPCKDSMLDKVRIRSFAKFVKQYGEEKFMDCLERNEKAGMVYHRQGELTGDYDAAEDEEGIIQLILFGNQSK